MGDGATLIVRDETAGSQVSKTQSLSFATLKVTVRDIIAERVRAEVEAFNNNASDYFVGLVQPTDAEQTLNGFKMQRSRLIDPEKQIATALEAFTRNGFFILVDDVQAERLEQVIELDRTSEVIFVKLTQLVGG